ncbi:hypothetical protein EDC04DRAFT_2602441 [Pisolithus marmoratus]|nr:hypothetical protein EDC04DRAFT_2602441 [Pisolithus marmoratus]
MVTSLAGVKVDILRSPSLWVPKNRGEAPSNFSLMTSSVPSRNEVVGVNGEGMKMLSLKEGEQDGGGGDKRGKGWHEPQGLLLKILRLVNLSLNSAISWWSLDSSVSRRFPWGGVGLGLFWYSLSHLGLTLPNSPSIAMGLRWALNEWNMVTTQWIALGATLSQVMGMVGTWKEQSLLGPPLVVQVQVRG